MVRLVDAVLDLVADLELTGDGGFALAGDGDAEAAGVRLIGELDEVVRLVEQLGVVRDGVVDDDFDCGVLEVEDGDLAGGFGVASLGLASALLLARGLFLSAFFLGAFGDLGGQSEARTADVGTARHADLRLDRMGVAVVLVLLLFRVFLVGDQLALDLDVASRVAQVERELLAVGDVVADAGAVGLLQFAGAVRFEDAHFARRQGSAQTVGGLVHEAQLHRDRVLGQVGLVVAVELVVLLAVVVRVVLMDDRHVTEVDERRAVGHAVFQRHLVGELVHLLVADGLRFGAILREVGYGLQAGGTTAHRRGHGCHADALGAAAGGGIRVVVTGDQLDAGVGERGTRLVGQVDVAGEAFELTGGAVVEHLVPGPPVDALGLVEHLDAEGACGLDLGLERQDGEVGQSGRDAVGQRELGGQRDKDDLTAHAQDGDPIVDDVFEDAGGAPFGARLGFLDQRDLGAYGLVEDGLGVQVGRAQGALAEPEAARAMHGDDGLAVGNEGPRQTADIELRLASRQGDVASLADDGGTGLIRGQFDGRGAVGLDDRGRGESGFLRVIRHECALPWYWWQEKFLLVRWKTLVLVYQLDLTKPLQRKTTTRFPSSRTRLKLHFADGQNLRSATAF